ncbi:MAG TPA: metallophosphoesterase, partial [Longimicrobium sp.]
MRRETVLDAVRRAADAFQARATGVAVTGIEHVPKHEAGEVARLLRDALEWARTHEQQELAAGETLEGEGDGDYASHNPVIALTQSALGDELPQPMGAAPPLPLRAIRENLRVRLTGDIDRFIRHEKLTDFVYPLAEQCTVVLVGDWGTGKERARKVADRIREFNPDHVIHMGDIYPSGTVEKTQQHFIDVWEDHGPGNAKYWSLIGNHDMDAKGVGFFGLVLSYCQDQEASYFSLQNEHWKLIGLDTAYREYDLEPRQIPWLEARLNDGGARNILLTHHQMFSAVDPRPRKDNANLKNTMKRFVDTGRIFGWFWGHEHWMLSYAREPKWGNYLARAIGHGGKRILNVEDQHNGHAPAVRHYWRQRHPTIEGRSLNGFVVMEFDGPNVTIAY